MTASTRPLLRYHGGKWRLANWIIANMPTHTVYVELYGGAASVLLQKEPIVAEIYNDCDAAVVNVFRVLQDARKARTLADRLALTPYSRAEFNRSYEPATDDVDWACKMIVRSFFGFGSDSMTRGCRTGFRARLQGTGSLPSQNWAQWPESVQTFASRLRHTLIEQCDALDLIDRYDSPTTLFYADPPYVIDTRSALRGKIRKSHGYRYEMSDEQHQLLANALRTCKGFVLLSGYDGDLYRSIYGDWLKLDHVSRTHGGQRRTECLWFNPAAAECRPQMLMSENSLFETRKEEAWPHAKPSISQNGTEERRSSGAANGAGSMDTSSKRTSASARIGRTAGPASAKTTTTANGSRARKASSSASAAVNESKVHADAHAKTER